LGDEVAERGHAETPAQAELRPTCAVVGWLIRFDVLINVE